MCLFIYVASDYPLPEIPWNEKNPAFFVTSEIGSEAECVRNNFTKPYVYYAGSHEGCGCGFGYDTDYELENMMKDYPDDLAKAKAENAARRESIYRLREYLEVAVESGDVELYAPWAGNEGKEPTSRLHVEPNFFSGAEVYIPDGLFLIVSKDLTSLGT
jgi:hypothetical protein